MIEDVCRSIWIDDFLYEFVVIKEKKRKEKNNHSKFVGYDKIRNKGGVRVTYIICNFTHIDMCVLLK